MAIQPSETSRKLSDIPVGHYHRVMEEGNPIRRAWHILKFRRVLELCNVGVGSLLDVGCFSGSLLSLASERAFDRQLGVDILPDQVEYAQRSFGTSYRSFQTIRDFDDLARLSGPFDYITSVEVIEHLTPEEIGKMLMAVAKLLRPGTGRLVMSTPNYTSAWPLLEALLNRFSDVDYTEQHITKFTYFGFEEQLRAVAGPAMNYFDLEVRTSTHLMTPFLALPLGVQRATALGSRLPHRSWPVPLGNLILVRMRRNAVAFNENRV